MLGIMSCGALPLSIMLLNACSLSASSLKLRAWLPTSSDNDPTNEFLRDEALLSADDAGPDVPSMMGVMGWDSRAAAAACAVDDSAPLLFDRGDDSDTEEESPSPAAFSTS
jgi:hypothetical protein